MRAVRVCRLLLSAAALLCLPLAAGATPVTYNWTPSPPSFVTVTATLLPATVVTFNGSPSLNIALTGSSFTFDSALVPIGGNDNSIIGFSFVTAATGPIAVLGLGPITSLSLGAITVSAGGGFTSAATGTGPFNFTMSGTAASGTFTTNFGGPTSFSGPTGATAFGSINVGTNTIRVQDITIGSITLGASTLLVKGDFIFHGVPEPATVTLFLVGAIAIGGALRRR